MIMAIVIVWAKPTLAPDAIAVGASVIIAPAVVTMGGSDTLTPDAITLGNASANFTTSLFGLDFGAAAEPTTVVGRPGNGLTIDEIDFDVSYNAPSGGTTYTVDSGGGGDYTTVQAAINAASPGDIIEVTAGQTFTENVSYPSKSNPGSDWIYLRSTAIGSLPAEGTRVGTGDVTNMPTIRSSTSGEQAFTCEHGSNYLRVVGIKFDHTGANTGRVVSVGNDASLYPNHHPSQTSEFPHHIVFDRCVVTQSTTNDQCQAGILLESRLSAVVDCYIYDIWHTGADSQAINIARGEEGFLIENNYLAGAGENFMIGGENIYQAHAFNPTDMIFMHNHLFKPSSWEMAGWVVKNTFELKAGKRLLIYENFAEQMWKDGQDGTVWAITPRDNDVQDVMISHNLTVDAPAGWKYTPANASSIDRVTFRNNYTEVDQDNWTGGGANFHVQLLAEGGKQLNDFTWTDNVHTVKSGTSEKSTAFLFYSGGQNLVRFTFEDNAWRHGSYGFFASAGSHQSGVETASDANLSFTPNYFIGGNSSNYSDHTQYASWSALESAQAWVPALRTDLESRIPDAP